MKQQNWEKEFDKKYYSKYIVNGERVPNYEMTVSLLENIKSFIRQLLKSKKRLKTKRA